VDGSDGIGPTFQNLYGEERQFADGTSEVADENYLRGSILNPGEDIVEGYQNIMPASYSSLSERELSGLVAYIKSLSDAAGEEPAAEEPAAEQQSTD
jgi:cytochrome c oxidase subunit 2